MQGIPGQTQQQQNRQSFVLLDISLLILDILDREKILANYLSDNIILEVPGALATMIVDAGAGNPLLRQFVTAYFRYIRNHYSTSSDEKIQRILKVSEEETEQFIANTLQALISNFAPLISGATEENRTSRLPINRYEPIFNLSYEDVQDLKLSYMRELNLLPNPAFDLYFLQILHAQVVGFVGSLTGNRELVSIGQCTNNAIKKWLGGGMRKFESSSSFLPSGHQINDREIQRLINEARERLNRVTRLYFRPVAVALVNVGVSITISISQFGTLRPEDLVLAIVGYTSSELIGRNIPNLVATPVPTPEYPYWVVGLLLLLCVILYYGIPRLVKLAKNQATASTPSPIQPVVLETPVLQFVAAASEGTPTVLTNPSVQQSDIETITPQISPASSSVAGNYCLYVIQPGDTLQSITLRFQITEDELRVSDKLVARGAFTPHQMIRVGISCCRVINDKGFSYTVQRGDTLYSIAKRNSVSLDVLKTINNLYDPTYIQTGQMLCIPYPG